MFTSSPATMVLKRVRGGTSGRLETLFQVLPWSMVLKICPLVLTVQTTPRLTLEIEKSVIEGSGGGGPPAGGCGVGVGCGGCAGG